MGDKKGKYKLVKEKTISFDEIYFNSKPELRELVEKYHGTDGDRLLFKNNPIALAAKAYVDNGDEFWSYLKESPFFKMSCERYNCSGDDYLQAIGNRIIDIIKSIKKHGYSQGKFKDKAVGVVIKDNGGYEIISGKHRAAACFALGIKEIKCKTYKKI